MNYGERQLISSSDCIVCTGAYIKRSIYDAHARSTTYFVAKAEDIILDRPLYIRWTRASGMHLLKLLYKAILVVLGYCKIS